MVGRAVPTERQVTGLGTYDSNLTTDVGCHTMGVLDQLKLLNRLLLNQQTMVI